MDSTQVRQQHALDALLRETRLVAYIVADADTAATVSSALRHPNIEINLTPHYGAIAAELFRPAPGSAPSHEPLFVLDLRSSCGIVAISKRSADYDAALHGHVTAGIAWPRTLCLVDSEQTHPDWLLAHPHMRATLLADEVETVVGQPYGKAWLTRFQAALDCCLRD